MSSVEKGNRLEDQVFDLFTTEIKAGRFLAKPSCCKIFRKKGYYSRDRQGDVVFDVSIEISLPGESVPSMLFLLECKNYGHAVPVDDIEEFFAKTQQVAASNCKAVVVSTNSFQKGTFNFAKSKGIGLLRYFGPSKRKWILHRTPALFFAASEADTSWKRAYEAVTNESFSSRGETFCGMMYELDGGVLATASIHNFFSSSVRKAVGDLHFAEIDTTRISAPRVVPYVELEVIAARAEVVLTAITYAGGPVSLERVCDWQKEEVGLTVRANLSPSDEEPLRGVLGRIQFSPLEIVTYAGSRPPVHAFTLAHELGHLLLGHGQYMEGEFCEELDLVENDIGDGDVKRMEWQANQFASCLLLPKDSVLADVGSLARQHDLADRGHGLIYVDHQPSNVRRYRAITDTIGHRYGVSPTAVTYRLSELGVLNDAERRGRPVWGPLSRLGSSHDAAGRSALSPARLRRR